MISKNKMRKPNAPELETSPSHSARHCAYPDIRGKHRKQVELNRLTKEISLLEEELKTLEGLPPASKCCKGVVESIEKRPDPLLPFVTRGQAISSWDRWFRKRSINSDCSCCGSCKHVKIWKFSYWKRFICWKLTFRKACCVIPRFSCYKCCCFQCSCAGCIKCFPLCKNKWWLLTTLLAYIFF